jgi:NADH-quinone oxidoreductase subunit C
MFGITFTGNPDMRNLYLPTDFEGYPLRKDFPLMARLVKPWPGIVDVEPMPPLSDDSEESPVANTVSAGAETAGQAQGAATTNPEDAS